MEYAFDATPGPVRRMHFGNPVSVLAKRLILVAAATTFGAH